MRRTRHAAKHRLHPVCIPTNYWRLIQIFFTFLLLRSFMAVEFRVSLALSLSKKKNNNRNLHSSHVSTARIQYLSLSLSFALFIFSSSFRSLLAARTRHAVWQACDYSPIRFALHTGAARARKRYHSLVGIVPSCIHTHTHTDAIESHSIAGCSERAIHIDFHDHY